MSRKLKYAFHTYEDGQLKHYLPGDELPEDIEAGDHLFASDEEQAEAADNTAELQGGNVEDSDDDDDANDVVVGEGAFVVAEDAEAKPVRRGRKPKAEDE